jgi:hypothetical protein
MKRINRRELNQRSGQIVDEVLATGEPVEVVGRDGRAVVISVKPETTYERWVREGLVIPAKNPGAWADVPRVASSRTYDEIRRDMEEDH